MKILVIGDIVVSCDLLVEAAKSLPGGEHEVVAVEWKSETRQEFQKKALNIEKNGPTAEEPPKEAYEQIGDADILLSHFCPIPENLIEAGKNLKLIGTCRGGMEHVDIAARETFRSSTASEMQKPLQILRLDLCLQRQEILLVHMQL